MSILSVREKTSDFIRKKHLLRFGLLVFEGGGLDCATADVRKVQIPFEERASSDKSKRFISKIPTFCGGRALDPFNSFCQQK
jgi:hypothetical protein